jgi:hypothetical protein
MPRMSLGRPLAVPLWLLACLVAVGAGLGGVAVYVSTDHYGVPVATTGTVTAVNQDSTAIGFTADGGNRTGEGMAITTHFWIDRDGKSYGGDTAPACLQPLTHGQRVELGVLDIRGHGPGPAKLIVWVRCLA